MGPKSNSASHWCRSARRGERRHNEFPSPKVESDASVGQFLVSLMIPVADVQRHIAEEFVFQEGFPCSFPPPLSIYMYIRGKQAASKRGRTGPKKRGTAPRKTSLSERAVQEPRLRKV